MFRNVRRIYRLWIMALPLLLAPGAGLAQTTLSVVAGSAIAGGAGSLSIYITSTSGYAPSALEWTLNYSGSTFGSFKVQTGAAAVAAGKSVDCRFRWGSARCLVWGMNDNTIANGVVATVSFRVVARAPVSSAVQLAGLVATKPSGASINFTGSGATLAIASTNHISGLACSPSTLVPPASATCTVTLTSAPSTYVDIAIGVNSSSAKLTIPSIVTIAAGEVSVTFKLTAGAVSASTIAVIVATIGASSASFSLLLKP